eukprot:711397-Rhodomonas_salina.1
MNGVDAASVVQDTLCQSCLAGINMCRNTDVPHCLRKHTTCPDQRASDQCTTRHQNTSVIEWDHCVIAA